MIDSGSSENVASEELIQKLNIKIEKHPKPYKLTWLQKGSEVTLSKQVLISFSMGNNYKDQIWCDVVTMDACHLLFRRPWQYNKLVHLNGQNNTYSFIF